MTKGATWGRAAAGGVLPRAPMGDNGRMPSLPLPAQALVESLRLLPHPEGGFYRETYRSPVRVQTPRGERSALTLIHFLLPAGGFSGFHRVRSDEAWHHVGGDPVELHLLEPDGAHRLVRLDAALQDGAQDHAVVPAGAWQAARPAGHQAGYALVSCAVAPGFEFEDFEMAGREALLALRPDLAAVLGPLCRG